MQPNQRSPWGLLVGDKVVGAESLMMQVPSGLRSFFEMSHKLQLVVLWSLINLSHRQTTS